MEPTRAAIAAIHQVLEGKLVSLTEQIEATPDDDSASLEALALQFRSLTDTAVWEAIYTLANHVDELREARHR